MKAWSLIAVGMILAMNLAVLLDRTEVFVLGIIVAELTVVILLPAFIGLLMAMADAELRRRTQK